MLPGFRFLFAAILSALVAAGGLAADPVEAGLPFMDYFGVRDYQEHNQTWGIAQDRRGTLYVGNKDCVLTFDGQTWRTLPVPGLFVRGLAMDASDRLWVGGVNELGYMDEDATGRRRYTSLLPRLAPDERKFGEIFEVFALPHGVYFSTDENILRWHDNRFTVLVSNDEYHAWVIGDELVLHLRDGRLRAFDGRDWRTLSEDPALRQHQVVSAIPHPQGGLLLATQRAGVWRLNQGALQPWPTPVDALLRQRRVGWAWRLRDGSLVISFRPSGLVILDAQGRLRHYLDEANTDLPSTHVVRIFQDRDDNVWIALNSGLLRFPWPPAISLFDKKNGLGRGTVKSFARVNGRLYVTTTNGLFVLHPARPDTVDGAVARFAAVPGTAFVSWGLAAAGDDLLVASVDALRVVRNDAVVQQVPIDTSQGTAVLAFRQRAGIALLGTSAGVQPLVRAGDRWELGAPFAGIAGEVRALVEDAEGSAWASVTGRGFYRLIGAAAAIASGRSPPIEHYPGGHGLDSPQLAGIPQLAASNGNALFLDNQKVFTFDAASRVFRPIASADDQFHFPGLRQPTLGSGLSNTFWTRTLRADPQAGPWKGRTFWRVTPPGRWEQLPFTFANAVGENPVIHEEPAANGSVLWIGGSEGLVRAEIPSAFRPARDFQARISQAADATGHRHPLGDSGPLVLPPRFDPLHFEFASDRLDERRMEFQARLEGRDDDWSAFTADPRLTVTGLAPGAYVLQVRARDADGRISQPAAFRFQVLPPWWRAWWAFGLYAGGLATGIAGIIRWRGRALRRRNEELEHLIASRTTELRDAKTLAESSSQAKSAFLASMSHELRTPLNAILGFAQIMRRSPGLSDEHRQRLAVINRNGDHLLQMINEILDLSKIEAGKLSLNPRPTDLPRLVQGLAETFAQRAADKGLAFRREFAADLPATVFVDEVKLRQVLINLLGNALKFTDAGQVNFHAGVTAKGTVRFTITDTGVGIPVSEQARIFEPFHQSAAAYSPQGTGLGLAISQRIVTLMGGIIRIESQPGSGSRFWFELALAHAEPAPTRPAGGMVTGYDGQRRRLLVVDDEAANREVLRALLEPLGFAIEECSDGRACLAAFQHQPADAILLDLRMPGELDGYATARALRVLPGGDAPALIAVSASVFEEDRQTALDAGCDAFVPKPFTEERLFGALGDCLDLKWILQEPASAGPAADILPVLPAGAAEELRDLARRGDVKAFRERLKAAEAAHPDCAAALAHLDSLAAGFQLGRLRQELRAARTTSSPPPP